MTLTPEEYAFIIANGALASQVGGRNIYVLHDDGGFTFYGSDGTPEGTSPLTTFVDVDMMQPEQASVIGEVAGRVMFWAREGNRKLFLPRTERRPEPSRWLSPTNICRRLS